MGLGYGIGVNVSIKGCLSLYVRLAASYPLVLQLGWAPELDKRMKMDGEFNKPWHFSVSVYPTFNH